MVAINEVTKFLSDIGINVFDNKGNYKSTPDILQEITDKINNENLEKSFNKIQTLAKLFL